MSSSWNSQLTDDQIDSLKEVGNVGAGHAASELARLTGRKCLVSVPELIVGGFQEIKKTCQLPDAVTVGLHMRIMGDIPASMLVITERKHAERILAAMQEVEGTVPGQPPAGPPDEITFLLALKQLGEVLTHSFSDAITEFLGDRKNAGPIPEIVMEDWSSAVEALGARPDAGGNDQMAIRADFSDCTKSFKGRFVYVLNPEAQTKILERIDKLFG